MKDSERWLEWNERKQRKERRERIVREEIERGAKDKMNKRR